MAKSALTLIVDNSDEDRNAPIAPGDMVRTGEHAYPCYRVIATSDDRAWVRDVQDGTDYVVSLARCRKI
jgi:hypothetical protein